MRMDTRSFAIVNEREFPLFFFGDVTLSSDDSELWWDLLFVVY